MTHRDVARLAEWAGILLSTTDSFREGCYRVRLEKFWGEWEVGRADPYEAIDLTGERSFNVLTTAGANALWNGLTTAGLATPFNATNAQVAVGDSSTAAAAGQTDLQAAAGATMNSGDVTGATNATPIVLTVASWTTTPVVGQTVVVAGVNGNTAANGTFEVSAVTGTTVTLLGSAGNGAFTTSAGSTVKPVGKYRQLINGAPAITTNTTQWVAVFGTANANHAWQEWGVSVGGAAVNKQASPPPTLLNRAVINLGVKTSASAWTFTVTTSLT
jgi:hypothetical protein